MSETALAQRTAGVADVANTFVELIRSFNRTRARIMAAAEHDVEWSAQVVLKVVHAEGPLRAGAIAEHLQSDPSTVSRQVATLVKDGMLERRADPLDGRASLLVLTPRGEDVVAAQARSRLDYFASMLDTWSEEELHDFADMLRRFATDYESATQAAWFKERLERAAGRAQRVPGDVRPTTHPIHTAGSTTR